MSLLKDLPSIITKGARRVGRGYGSTKGGHTAGRGQKGQKSRNGGKIPLWFEGGQLPLIKRLPMQRGKGKFKSLDSVQEVQLKAVVGAGITTITAETLREAGLIRAHSVAPKLIGAVEVAKKLKVEGVRMTKTVQAAIEKAGGTVSL
jgi:large subunit ribosomal protein L15